MYTASFLIKFLWDRFGLVWAFYFLWMNQIAEAGLVGMYAFILGTAMAWMIPPKVLISPALENYFKKMWDVRLFAIRGFGYLATGYCLFEHYIPGIVFGAGIMITGHLTVVSIFYDSADARRSVAATRRRIERLRPIS